MKSEEDFVLRPAIEGVCLYESLVDGKLDLCDVARMNDALDIRMENQKRLALEATKHGR